MIGQRKRKSKGIDLKRQKMQLKTKISKTLLNVLIIFSVSSCGYKPVSFTPDFYAADYENSLIINEEGDTVSCSEERFNEFVATPYTKVVRLADILAVAQVPWWFKDEKQELLNELREFTTKLEESRH